MGPFKHYQYYGSKRHRTGVADYFAVLGMDVDDNSFLFRDQPRASESAPPMLAEESSSTMPHKISPISEINSTSLNKHNVRLDSEQAQRFDLPNTSTAGNDGHIDQSSVVDNGDCDTTKTPRNNRNLTKKLHPPGNCSYDYDNENTAGINKQSTGTFSATKDMQSDKDEKNRNLYVERFDRDIIELALLLSSPGTTKLSTMRTNHDSGSIVGERFCCCWADTNMEDGSYSLPIVTSLGNRLGKRTKMNEAIQRGLKVAYRRRRQCSHPSCGCGTVRTTKEKDGRGKQLTSSEQTQHDYFAPGIAEIDIHYVKLRPSIVLFPDVPTPIHDVPDKASAEQLHDDNDKNHHGRFQSDQRDTIERTFMNKLFSSSRGGTTDGTSEDWSDDGTSSSRAGGVTARHITSLARQGAGLLVNVVKKTTSQTSSSVVKETVGTNNTGHIDDGDGDEVDFDGECVHKSFPVSLSSDIRKRREHFFPDENDAQQCRNVDEANCNNHDDELIQQVSLLTYFPLPTGFDEWVVPDFCETLHLPSTELSQRRQLRRQQQQQQRQQQQGSPVQRRLPTPILFDRTHSIPSGPSSGGNSTTTPSSVGMELMYLSPTNVPLPNSWNSSRNNPKHALNATESIVTKEMKLDLQKNTLQLVPDPDYLPILVSNKSVPFHHTKPIEVGSDDSTYCDDSHIFIPILAIRRQRTGDEERFHEDACIVDIRVIFLDSEGTPPLMADEDESENILQDDFGKCSSASLPKLTPTIIRMQSNMALDILSKTKWTRSTAVDTSTSAQNLHCSHPIIMVRRNVPDGFSDIPFAAAKVLDRFPRKNYHGMPFPEEEMPLFCYPGGNYLVRDKLGNRKLPKSFGFVVKNERGDSTYVICLSFLEPLSKRRRKQLDSLSIRRRQTSLPHRSYWNNMRACTVSQYFHTTCLVRFDDDITFESKTICLLGRYPFWTEFRRFLTHLHLLSASSSDIPIERNISHLLLSVPMPRPGGPCVLVPFSTMDEPMALALPPLKDLPLVDLSYHRLFSALDVPTVVTIVLGFLCLERKLILISTRQSLLLDCCELLKSLLFPFDICAPYVPHLTQPFMSCLEFPGAIFVGIHDDEQPNSLAKIVRNNIPEEGIIVELDSGEINCDGNRYEILKSAYQIIPSEPRILLIREVERICLDAGIVPGQEPLDFGVDSACQVIESTFPSNMRIFEKNQERLDSLDDRLIRDSFLRFFCSILGGYERFLVVPDADYLTSGNDWFDSSAFVGTVPANRTPYLRTFVQTQMFQSFIQRRTEASDVHCMLFDECLAEYYASNTSFGRFSCNISDDDCSNQVTYLLLIDQCATEPDQLLDDDESSLTRSEINNKSIANDNDASTQASSGYADSSMSEAQSLDKESQFSVNASGDIVTIPSTAHLSRAIFVYCDNGTPSFPTEFDQKNFLPIEPEVLETDSSQLPTPILTRSEREREEALRIYNATVSRRGPQKQHRCLWQLAKLMGTHFLGAWLMCVPTQLSQPNLSLSDKSKILLRSLGALRNLRSYRRIVADEAAYRALIVACGRCGTDRRIELMKIYGLLRADGIFPNAVTLGQYTKAIAEGYSNASINESSKVGMQVVIPIGTRKMEQESFSLEILDSNLSNLEESGLKWRSSAGKLKNSAPQAYDDSSRTERQPVSISPAKTFDTSTTQRSLRSKRSWLPVCCSSSFLINSRLDLQSIRLVAMWSRTSSCKSCGYIPLDEEIQSGWDEVQIEINAFHTISCPRCAGLITPSICYKEMTVDELMTDSESSKHETSSTKCDGENNEPPQLNPIIREIDENTGCVAYLSPLNLRIRIEELVLEYGDDILERTRLRKLHPDVFFNLWWYSARFSLPLPLSVKSSLPTKIVDEDGECGAGLYDFCSFACWESTLALEACRSAAKALRAAHTLSSATDRLLHEKLFDNPNTDNPLLSYFNMQSYAQSDWDHPDFSEILVALVKACETRDLLPVIDCVLQRNQARDSTSRDNSFVSLNESFDSKGSKTTNESINPKSSSLDCYRTIIYLARYQCTTAFHAFFPTTTRPCKGHHFWCAQGTAPLPIFDRAFREAAENYSRRRKLLVPIPDVSGVALGFRSVFGHII